MTLGEELKFRKLNYVREAIQKKCQRIEGIIDANIYEAVIEELETYKKCGIIKQYWFSECWGSFYIEYPT